VKKVGPVFNFKPISRKPRNPAWPLLRESDVSGTLLVQAQDVDSTTRKMLSRMDELDVEMSRLRRERDSITATLASIGYRPPGAHPTIYSSAETKYKTGKPFRNMSLTDACLTVLRDQAKREELHEQWLNKNQVEYLVVRGGYEFEAGDSVNSVHVTLRRLALQGLVQANKGKGSRSSRYHFIKDREE